MRNVPWWASVIWLPASIVFAQEPIATERQAFDPAKSAVTVVFAPEDQRARANEHGNPGAEPREFAAPGGAIGLRLGEKLKVGSIVTIGEDGRLRFECAPLQEGVKKVMAARRAAPPSRKDAAHEK